MKNKALMLPAFAVLCVLVLVYVLNFVDRQIISILANDIKRDLDLTDADLGFLYGTAFGVFYSLFGIPLGKLADGWNRTRLLTAGLALWSTMTAFSGLAKNGFRYPFAQYGIQQDVRDGMAVSYPERAAAKPAAS